MESRVLEEEVGFAANDLGAMESYRVTDGPLEVEDQDDFPEPPKARSGLSRLQQIRLATLLVLVGGVGVGIATWQVVEASGKHKAPTVARGCSFDSSVTEWVHDPSSFFVSDDVLLAYTSGSNGKPLQAVSVNLADGSYKCLPENVTVFADGVPTWAKDFQKWNPTGEFDAPAQLDGGKFVYYTVYDEEGGEVRDAIGVAENVGTPTMPEWSDLGVVVQSFDEKNSAARAMDPTVMRDGSDLWLFCGSHGGGIFTAQLDPVTMKLLILPDTPNTTEADIRFNMIAQHYNNASGEPEIEAPFVWKRGDFYYLFTNFGKCCNGASSTYYITVGRSNGSLTGPYMDKDGVYLYQGGGTTFLESEGRYVGPGHAGVTELADGSEVFTYHFYDAEDKGISKLGVRKLSWDDDGWPVLGDHLVKQPPY